MKKEITNTASDGLNLDLHPIVTPNSVLTDNLNGTFITYNGNEFSLQNDRGNTLRAELNEGFIPIAIKERNGVLYIVSVREIEDDGSDETIWETEIGTYPGVNWDIDESEFEKWHELDSKHYKPLKNLDNNDFRTTKLEYNTKTPLDIEIQDSYDGSVNLIISDKIHDPILINSGFSVDGSNYKINKPNIRYSSENFETETKFIKTIPSFMNFEFDNVYKGGQLKGGNYTFYAYLGDSDGNKTDVAAESGIVSIYNGDVNEPKYISGTLADERTDKLVKLKLVNIPTGYSNIYISYVREYSDTNGYLMTEACNLDEPFATNNSNSLEIIINGFETERFISIEQLNINYLPISSYKTAAQQQSMLFIGNVNNDTQLDYAKLTEAALCVKPKLVGKSIENPMSLDYNEGDYYDPKNIYESVGYWPGEYYRFGIVFIKSDGMLTPAFPITGGGLKYQDDRYISDVNDDGVIKFPMEDVYTVIRSNGNTVPWGLELDWSGMKNEIQNSKMADLIKGFFIVRQKRIPEAICQGLQIHLDEKTHIPVMPISWVDKSANDGRWCFTESFLNQEHHTLDYSPESADSTILGLTVSKRYYAKIYVHYPDKRWIGREEACCPIYALLTYDGDGGLLSCTTSFLADKEQYRVLIDNLHVGFEPKKKGEWINEVRTSGKDFDSANYDWEFNDDDSGTFNESKMDKMLHSLLFDDGDLSNSALIQILENYFEQNKLSTDYAKTESDLVEHVVSCKPYTAAFGILSQEAMLDPSVRNKLDGSKFELSYRSTVVPINYINNQDVIRRFKLQIQNDVVIPTEDKVNSVWVKENTPSKVINDCVFSNVIGSAENIQDIATLQSETVSKARTTLIRGLYTSYIGVTSPFKDTNNRAYLRIVQLSKRLEKENAYAIRKNDKSPFYSISNRISFDENNTKLTVFRGDCYVTTQTIRINRNFIDPNYPYSDAVIKPEAWYKYYLHKPTEKKFDDKTYSKSAKTAWDEINSTDVNTVSLGHWVTFKCLASSNLGLRSEDPFDVQMTANFGPKSFFPKSGSTSTADKQEESKLFNAGYGITVGRKKYKGFDTDIQYVNQEYSNRIMFSNIDVQSEFVNGYRIFEGESFKDYDKQYGPIVKLVSWENNLVCVFEHGLALIGVNQQALMQTTTDQTIHIYGHGVLPDQMSVISQDYGTRYADSVVKTPIGIYGIDTDAKKIWRFSNKKGFETLSDMKIETFLNNTLAERYNIDIDNSDVRTHYNAFKGDVIFTWYIPDPSDKNVRILSSICFNERQALWTTRYNWVPLVSENSNGEFYTLQRGEDVSGVGIYHHDFDKSTPTKWYGKQQPFEYEFVVSDPIGVQKIFENLVIISNNVQPEELQFEFIGDSYFFNKTRIYHTVFEKDFADKRYFGNEITRNLRLFQSDPSRKNEQEFTKVNVAQNLQRPFRNASILNDRDNKPLFGHIKQTNSATKEYHLVIPQECRNIETWGRRLGNMQYNNGVWHTTIEPILYDNRLNDPTFTSFEGPATKWNSARIRDKWCKIRIRYSGEDLAVITAIKTIVNI